MPLALLQRIVNGCDGALAAVVVRDGRVLGAHQRDDRKIDADALGGALSPLLAEVRNAASILEVGQLDALDARSGDVTLLVRMLAPGCFVGLAIEPEGNFGQGRFLLRTALFQLRAAVAAQEVPPSGVGD